MKNLPRNYQPGFLFSFYALFLYVCVVSIFPSLMDDFFFYLALGDQILTNGGLPATDPYLFSMPNSDWHVSHEWITYLVYTLAFKNFDFQGAITLKSMIIATATVLPFIMFRGRIYSSPIPMLLAILGVTATYVRQTERGSLFTDLLTTLILCTILLTWRNRKNLSKNLYMLPLVFLIWANTHAGFISGLLLLYVWAGAELARYFLSRKKGLGPTILKQRLYTIVGVVTISTLCTILNPEGIYVFSFPLNLLFSEYFYVFKIFNAEWNATYSLWKNAPESYVALLLVQSLTLIVAMLHLVKTVKTRPRDLAISEAVFIGSILALLLYFSHSSVRFTALGVHWSIALAVYLFAGFGSLSLPPQKRPSSHIKRKFFAITRFHLPGIIALILVAMVATDNGKRLGFSEPFRFGVNSIDVPIRATEFIENSQLQGNIFNEHKYGAYLAWRWKGTRKIFFHGFVVDPVFYNNEYIGVYRSREEFDRIVETYDIKIFFMQKLEATVDSGPLLFQILLASKDWTIVYMDESAVIFAHADSVATMKKQPKGS